MTAGVKSPTWLSPDTGVTVAACLQQAVIRLRSNTHTPQLEAEVLLAHVLQCPRTYLFAHPEQHLLPRQLTEYQTLVSRRVLGKPLAYLTGRVEFYGLEFAVDERVLIPRPDTETLVDASLAYVRRNLRDQRASDEAQAVLARPVIVDVGTGSGCIAIALALNAPYARIFAADVSEGALDVARANAQHHGVSNNIAFLGSDLLEGLPERADVIVTNPPYIAEHEWSSLPVEVREHEPRLALDGGVDGLSSVRRLLSQAPACLQPGGAVFMEIGAAQGPDAIRLASEAFPHAELAIDTDLGGRDRVLCVRTGPGGTGPLSDSS